MNNIKKAKAFMLVAAICLCAAAGLHMLGYMLNRFGYGYYSIRMLFNLNILFNLVCWAGLVLLAVPLFRAKPDSTLAIVGIAMMAGAYMCWVISDFVNMLRWGGAAYIYDIFLDILYIGGAVMLLVTVLLFKKRLRVVRKLWFVPMAIFGTYWLFALRGLSVIRYRFVATSALFLGRSCIVAGLCFSA